MLVELLKGRSNYQFYFGENNGNKYALITVNYKTSFQVSPEFANSEIQRLEKEGYKKIILK